MLTYQEAQYVKGQVPGNDAYIWTRFVCPHCKIQFPEAARETHQVRETEVQLGNKRSPFLSAFVGICPAGKTKGVILLKDALTDFPVKVDKANHNHREV